jgi:predicted ester cyclase
MADRDVQQPAAEGAPEANGRGDGSAELAPYSGSRPNPGDFSISLGAKGGTDALLARDQGPQRQSMRGFDPAYVDIIDYIVRITHRIWEEKDIGYIYDCYKHNCRVMDDAGLQYGRDKIVADTVHTINAFPDIRLYADEIIWAGDDRSGFHTSHRTVILGHNTGHSRYGPPTGRKVMVWCIANCVALENEIFEEWVIYNNGSLLRQLGFDLPALARRLANENALPRLDDPRMGEVERLLGQGKPRRLSPAPDGPFDVEDFLRRLFHETWNWRNLSAIDRAYAANVRFHGATDRELYGRGGVKAFALSLLSMFPDLALQVDDVYFMGNDADGYVASVRWTAVGTHRGHGIYGAPTGRRALLWGLSQHRVVGGEIVEEWTAFNELDVLQQLLRDEPAPLPA